jgi:hypothetical protein
MAFNIRRMDESHVRGLKLIIFILALVTLERLIGWAMMSTVRH